MTNNNTKQQTMFSVQRNSCQRNTRALCT